MVVEINRLPKIDLPMFHLVEIKISVFLRVSDPSSVHEKEQATSEQPAMHFTPYSRRKQKHLIFEAIRRHVSDPGKYLVEITYKAGDELPTNPVPDAYDFGPTALEFLKHPGEVEHQVAGLEFHFDLESSPAKRLQIVFPIIADPSVMYPIRPANMPVDRVMGITAYKSAGRDGEFEYNLSLSVAEDRIQLLLVIPLEEPNLSGSVPNDVIERAPKILHQIGVIAK